MSKSLRPTCVLKSVPSLDLIVVTTNGGRPGERFSETAFFYGAGKLHKTREDARVGAEAFAAGFCFATGARAKRIGADLEIAHEMDEDEREYLQDLELEAERSALLRR